MEWHQESRRWTRAPWNSLQLCIVCCSFLMTSSVIPTGQITTRKIMGTTTILYVAPGSFSSALNAETDAVFMRIVKPVSGLDGCNPVAPQLRNNLGFYLLVSRGNCSFIDKAIAAKNVGAFGVVVYNSIQGIYQGNNYASDIDYECDNGSGYVDTVLDPVYSNEMDALMPTSCTQNPSCSSKRCVVTNATHPILGTKVCCAWDLYTTMGASYTEDDESMPNIPAVFIRMQDASTLMKFDELVSLNLEVALFARPSSMFDFASILIWLIAVVTVATGATLAAEEDKLQQQGLKGLKSGYRNYDIDSDSASMASDPHYTTAQRSQPQHRPIIGSSSPGGGMEAAASAAVSTGTAASAAATAAAVPTSSSTTSNDPEMGSHHHSSPYKHPKYGQNAAVAAAVESTQSAALASTSGDSSMRSGATRRVGDQTNMGPLGRRKYSGGNGASAVPAKGSYRSVDGSNDIDPDSLQITPYHAVGFVVLSSCFLLLMYFVNVYFFVSLLYLAAAAFASSKVLFYPFFSRVQRTCKAIQLGVEIDEVPEYSPINESSLAIDTPLLVSGLISAALSVTWFLHSEEIQWVWLIQDFLGISVCIMFLSTVHLPNLQAATMLLGLAFCYDVFFVFISPYVFGSSVMVKVATGPTVTMHTDENYCEKYPSDRDCDTNTLPMLLIVPTFSSYLSTESMLGLGDIVLPGLLLAWAARLDIRVYGSLSSPYASKGYFPMVVFGYAIGLMAANFAVEYFETGQPALLYIVPLTLGPVLLRSFKAGTLPELWRGLPRMKTIAQPFDRTEQEALLSGRASIFPAEASWTEKAADLSADYISYGPFGRSAIDSLTFEQYNSAAVAARPLSGAHSASSSRRSRNDGLL